MPEPWTDRSKDNHEKVVLPWPMKIAFGLGLTLAFASVIVKESIISGCDIARKVTGRSERREKKQN